MDVTQIARRAGQAVMVLGLLALPVLADPGPKTVGTRIDPDNLVRFNDRLYSVEHEDWVDSTPISVSRVTKIAFGKRTQVDIATTTTGVYSSEAMFSPHVQYPGVTVERVVRKPWFFFSERSGTTVRTRGQNSRTRGYSVVVTNGLTCVYSRSFAIC